MALDGGGDVLHERNITSRSSDSGQRRVSNTTSGASSGDGRLAVEQVGVGALAAVLGQAVGEVAQRRGDVDRVGVLRLRAWARSSSWSIDSRGWLPGSAAALA